MTPQYIRRIFEKGDVKTGLNAREISEQTGNEITIGALNRHLRRLSRGSMTPLSRAWENGKYVYYKRQEKSR